MSIVFVPTEENSRFPAGMTTRKTTAKAYSLCYWAENKNRPHFLSED
jgi:hypothetical protein